MSTTTTTLRPLQRQILRPHLSARYVFLSLRQQQHHRQSSTSSTTTPTTSPSISPPPRRNYRSAIIWSTLSLLLGIGAGQFATHTFIPPTMPSPGSHDDAVLIHDLEKRIDNEFQVKVLRGKCLGVTKALRGEQTGWVEIVPVASGSDHEGSKIGGEGGGGGGGGERGKLPPLPGNGGALMASLRGAANLGVERTFWSAQEQKLISIVWLGSDLSGWPGVVHGGLLATALTEKIALANALANRHGRVFAADVSDAVAPQRMPGEGTHATMSLPRDIPVEPAQVSIDYLKPTYANGFHVIRVVPSWATEEAVRIPVEGGEWIATLETLEKQKTCVRAASRFEPRSQAERARDGDNNNNNTIEGARWSYSEFKEWLWPSRQKQILQSSLAG